MYGFGVCAWHSSTRCQNLERDRERDSWVLRGEEPLLQGSVHGLTMPLRVCEYPCATDAMREPRGNPQWHGATCGRKAAAEPRGTTGWRAFTCMDEPACFCLFNRVLTAVLACELTVLLTGSGPRALLPLPTT